MGIARGTIILSGDETRGFKAGVYLGEDPDGTGIWAPFGTIEKIEPGDFDSAPETFANAINAGAQVQQSVVGGDAQQPTTVQPTTVQPTQQVV